MIKAAHNKLFDAFFGLYLHAHMQFAFRNVNIVNNFADQGGSMLLIGNHFSWWDGFIARHVNKKVLKRKLHLMMDETQLDKRKFLSKLGAFSIRKHNRSAIESLKYASEIIRHPENLLILYPQGRFQSLHHYPVTFEKGWFRVIQEPPDHLQIVFMAALVDYFSSPRPGLTIYLENANHTNLPKSSPESASCESSNHKHFSDYKSVERAYNSFYLNAIGMQNKLAE